MHSGIVSSFSTSALDKIKVMSVAVSGRIARIDRADQKTQTTSCGTRLDTGKTWHLQDLAPCKLWQTGWEEASDDERTTDDETARGAGGLRAHDAAEAEGDRLAIRRFRLRRRQAGLQGVRPHGAGAGFRRQRD